MHDRSPTDPFPATPEEEVEESRPHRPPPGLALDPPEEPPPEHPPEIPLDRLDSDAVKVIARLRHMRHRAYFVGGCVRDLLLGAKPKDFDVATDAHPGEVRAIFRNCRLIGRRFRLAHVYFRGGKVIEVATFRKNPVDVGEDVPDDSDLLITRDNVFGTAEEDSVRRDFTVNGLFYDVSTGEVIDYVGGREDLEAHRIATIGDPEIRMREDPVRLLRAVRFAARLGFTISPDTFEAMRRHAGELARCAPARVLEEIFKILRCGGSARAFELLRASGALPVILPSLAAALEGWEERGRRAFFAHLSALDRLVRSGEEVSDAVLLGAIVMHLGGPAIAAPDSDATGDHAGPERGHDTADALLASLVQTSRLPRKIAERTRLALHALRTFREPSKKRRRRGRGLAGQSYFQDAVQLLEISVAATGEGQELLERWRASAGGPPPREEHEERRPRPERGPERRRGPAAAPAHVEGSTREVVAEAGPGGATETPSVEVTAGGESPRTGAEGTPEAAEGSRRRRRHRGGKRRRRRGAGAPAPAGS
ncbi:MULTISPECIES: CCA tRNA nucleotidyltransferase [Anaeromyxobacter]|uniref:CCA tRNA nucleotidyltransferase n=1 Tax=Anaeromyxobacter TaxID=161492 RepID=UPI001F5AF160|nr:MULTISPECIES: polynucleotide adenylyltransferase PcnB [unclassified Anaeromyxobacter]